MGVGSLALAILATALGQIAFKDYALNASRRALLVALSLFSAIPFLTYFSVRELGLGMVYVSTGLSYVLVAVMGRLRFGEPLTAVRITGLFFIVLGCALYGAPL